MVVGVGGVASVPSGGPGGGEGLHLVRVVVLSGSIGGFGLQKMSQWGPVVLISRAQLWQLVYEVRVWAACLGQQPGGLVMVVVQGLGGLGGFGGLGGEE